MHMAHLRKRYICQSLVNQPPELEPRVSDKPPIGALGYLEFSASWNKDPFIAREVSGSARTYYAGACVVAPNAYRASGAKAKRKH